MCLNLVQEFDSQLKREEQLEVLLMTTLWMTQPPPHGWSATTARWADAQSMQIMVIPVRIKQLWTSFLETARHDCLAYNSPPVIRLSRSHDSMYSQQGSPLSLGECYTRIVLQNARHIFQHPCSFNTLFWVQGQTVRSYEICALQQRIHTASTPCPCRREGAW